MRYYYKFGLRFIVELGLVGLWLFYIYMDLHRTDGIEMRWLDGVFAVGVILIIGRNFKYLRLALLKQPLLEFDEVSISDKLAHQKYFWNDIDEITEEGGFLRIKLYPESKPLNDSPKGILNFYIDVRYIRGDLNHVLDNLNLYSIKAQQVQPQNER
jgi:hypothetical protein